MRKLELALQNKKYKVFNIGYRGVSGSYQQILNSVAAKLSALIENEKRVHFIGHSFGGILIRGLLDQKNHWNLGRCVMLGTPNQGTNTAAFMACHPVLRFFTPEAAKQLTPGNSLLSELPEPSVETGIIAGNKQQNWLIPVTWFYKKATNNAPGDGVVEISNTKCRNMSDFLELPLHHSFMMWDSKLIEQAIHFVEHGHFNRLL